jgi:hypothetical protein
VIPPVAVHISIPTWIWWAALAVFVIVDVAWNVYRVQAVLDQLDKATDDADKGARGVERHEEEIEAIKIYLAARDDADTDEMPAVRTDTDIAPKIDVVGGAKISVEKLRPVPHKREGAA